MLTVTRVRACTGGSSSGGGGVKGGRGGLLPRDVPGAASLLKQASDAGIPKATRALRALERQVQAADTHAKHAAAAYLAKNGDLGKPKYPLAPPSTSPNRSKSSAAAASALTEEKEDEEAAARAQAYREVHEAHAKAKAARASERASVESKLANAKREVATAAVRRLEEA